MFAFPKPGPKIKKPRARLGARVSRVLREVEWDKALGIVHERPKYRRSGRERDPVFLDRVRRLPCVCIKAFPGHVCEGRVEADHVGPRPLGRKCHDHEAVPMCQRAHWERTNYVGLFRSFAAAEMRAWCDERIAETRLKLGWRQP